VPTIRLANAARLGQSVALAECSNHGASTPRECDTNPTVGGSLGVSEAWRSGTRLVSRAVVQIAESVAMRTPGPSPQIAGSERLEMCVRAW
jgi:hypothetical protein